MDKYNVLVQKLAGEIIDSAIMEKEAGVTEQVKAGANAVSKTVGTKGAVGFGAGAAAGASAAALKAKSARQVAERAARNKAVAIGAGAGAAGLGAGYLAGKQAFDESETEYMETLAGYESEEEYMERLAAEEQEARVNAIIEKAASVYEEAQFLKQAAEEAAEEAALYEKAATQIFEELGLLDGEEYVDGEYEE